MTRKTARLTALGATVGLAVALGAAPALAAPSNDAFGNARTIRAGTTVSGTIDGATGQRGEPKHGTSLAAHSVWYRLTSRRKLAVALDTCRTNFDSVVAVYTGRSLRALRAVEYNNDGCGSGVGGSRVTFTARRGRVYRIAVAGFAASGDFRLRARAISVPPNDDMADAARIRPGETISASSRNATRELGEPRHSYNEPHTVWFRLSVAAPARVTLSNCAANTDHGHVGVYTGRRVSDLTRVIVNGDCRVEFDAAPGRVYRIVVEDGGGGGPVRLSAAA
jgi:hypothetical protein